MGKRTSFQKAYFGQPLYGALAQQTEYGTTNWLAWVWDEAIEGKIQYKELGSARTRNDALNLGRAYRGIDPIT